MESTAPPPARPAGRWLRHAAGSVLAALAALLLATQLGPLRTAEAWSRDVRHHLVPATADGPAPVAVLYVTEALLDRLACRVPLDRHYLARKLSALREAGPAALGIDILFDHPAPGEAELLATLDALPFPVIHAWIGEAHGLRANQAARLEAFLGPRQRGLATFLVDRRDGLVRELPPTDPAGATPLAVALATSVGVVPPALPRPLAYSPELPGGQPWITAYPLDLVERIVQAEPDAFRGKVLLVGMQSPLRDVHRAPFAVFGDSDGLPGVMVHAHAVAQLLGNIVLRAAPPWADLLLALLLAGAGWLLSLRDVALALQALAALGVLAGYAGITLATYATTQLFLPLVAPALALAGGLLGGALSAGRQLRRQRARVRRTFAQYVPAQVVEQLVDLPTADLLAGQRATVTCLFTDIAGFTRLAEHMQPPALVALMNRYLDGVTRAVHRHGGTVDKFIGDAVVAFFGAPIAQPDHADRAVAAGVEIRRETDALRTALAADGLDLGETRIGIHTGDAVIGNVGGELRQNYTALGDAVNLASRLEGANRYLGSRVCVSEETVRLATAHRFRPLATVVVKGRGQPIAVHEPLALRDHDSAHLARYLEAYRGLEAGTDDRELHEAWSALVAQDPLDGVAALHLARLERGEHGTLIPLEGK